MMNMPGKAASGSSNHAESISIPWRPQNNPARRD
jgi:hypothetical protein